MASGQSKVIVVWCIAAIAMAPAMAQELPELAPVTMSLTEPELRQPRPLQETVEMGFTATVTCETGVFVEPVPVTFSATGATDTLAVSVEPGETSVEFSPEECSVEPSSKEVEATLTIRFSADAVALVENPVSLIATAGNGSSDTKEWQEQAALEGRLQVGPIGGGPIEPDGDGTLRTNITNDANGEIMVTVTLDQSPVHGLLSFPEPFTLPARMDDAGPHPVQIGYQGASTQQNTFVIAYLVHSTVNSDWSLPTELQHVTILPDGTVGSVDLAPRPTENESPAPGAWLGLGGMLVLACLMRRRIADPD